MLPSGDIVPATLVRNNKTGRVIPLVSVSPAPGLINRKFLTKKIVLKIMFFQEVRAATRMKILWFEKQLIDLNI